MRFGKIQYLNLLPFDVFVKSYPATTRFKSAAFANRSYPSKLNQSFLFHRIDAGFISTIAGATAHRKHKATQAGIIAKGAVWSVLSLESNGDSALLKKHRLTPSDSLVLGSHSLESTFEKVDSRVDCHAAAHAAARNDNKTAQSKNADSSPATNASEPQNKRAESAFDKRVAGGRIFDEKAGLCSGEQGDKTCGLSRELATNSTLFRKTSKAVQGEAEAGFFSKKPTPKTPKAESPRKDYQSDTSNALSTILGLHGRVLIGDRALQYRFNGGEAIDMGQVWWEKHRLPFVFGRLCYNSYGEFYNNIAQAFVKKRVKIPRYILQARAKACGIPPHYVREYLAHIHYHIHTKERVGLERFYRALRLKAIKPPSRIYPRNVDSSKCTPNTPYKGSSNV